MVEQVELGLGYSCDDQPSADQGEEWGLHEDHQCWGDPRFSGVLEEYKDLGCEREDGVEP